MKRIDTETAVAAVKALSKVLGKCECFGEDKADHKVWFVWGPSKSHYPPEDKVQFGLEVSSVKQVCAAAEKLGIPEDKQR